MQSESTHRPTAHGTCLECIAFDVIVARASNLLGILQVEPLHNERVVESVESPWAFADKCKQNEHRSESNGSNAASECHMPVRNSFSDHPQSKLLFVVVVVVMHFTAYTAEFDNGH